MQYESGRANQSHCNATDPLVKKFHRPDKEKRSHIVIPYEFRKDSLNLEHRKVRELLNEIDAFQFHA